MTDTFMEKVEGELAAEMRLAFTRATVNFPKSLDVTPIAITVSNIFSDVFHELKRARRWSVRKEYDPLSEEVIGLISRLVNRAREELMMKNVPAKVTAGMSFAEKKSYQGLVYGLDLDSAKELIRYARMNAVLGSDKREILRRRGMLLSIRHNMLANSFASDAVKSAQEYFMSEVPDA